MVSALRFIHLGGPLEEKKKNKIKSIHNFLSRRYTLNQKVRNVTRKSFNRSFNTLVKVLITRLIHLYFDVKTLR